MDDLIKVMIVDDSPVQRTLLKYILTQDDQIYIQCIESCGEDAIEALKTHKVDIILMDINMPHMSGFVTSKNILEKYPIPIVLISATWDIDDAKEIIKSMELGVVAAIKKPDGIGSKNYEYDSKILIQSVKEYSEIKVVRRYPPRNLTSTSLKNKEKDINTDISLVFIGSSAGGPPALKDILAPLDKSFSFPIIVSQHMTDGFSEIFARWLDSESKIDVKLAISGEKLNPGTVYIVPSENILDIDTSDHIYLSSFEKNEVYITSISKSFQNTIRRYGKKVLGIILSGMGKDGVDQLKVLYDLGGITVAQDQQSSIVYGMPYEASLNKAVSFTMEPSKIGLFLNNIHQEKRVSYE